MRLSGLAIVLAALTLAACGTAQPQPIPRAPAVSAAPAPAMTPAPNVPGNPDSGRQLFEQKGCGGCHTLTALPDATGVIGPPLDNVALRPTIAGEDIPNSPDTLARWIMDPPSLKPDTQMPKLGLSADQAHDVAAFLYSLPYTSH